MTVLLDTHVLIWAWNGDTRLRGEARRFIEDPATSVVVSIATFWELAIKSSIGKLDIEIDLEALVGSMDKFGFQLLPVTLDHTLELALLPLHHRDPFDRTLIAQARHEGLTLLTVDPHFSAYDVQLFGNSVLVTCTVACCRPSGSTLQAHRSRLVIGCASQPRSSRSR